MAARKKKSTGKTRAAKKTSAKAASKAVWKRAAPAKAKHTHLSPQTKAAAKKRAKRAGRPYPNLVDNMQAAKRSRAAGRK